MATVFFSGVGLVLPGGEVGTCDNFRDFFSAVTEGKSLLSSFSLDTLPIKIGGVVKGWDIQCRLGLSDRCVNLLSRPAALALDAVHHAMMNADLTIDDIDPDRTVIIAASLQYASPEMEEFYNTVQKDGALDLGMAYWHKGTPPSVIGSVASILKIPCATLSIAGSCNVGLRATQIAVQMMEANAIDRAIIVGVDSTIDPVFVASSVFKTRSGFRASSLSANPNCIRPHDQKQSGNATGEGAVALIIDREIDNTTPVPNVEISFKTSRSNGNSAVATGSAENVASDMCSLLLAHDVKLQELAFISDYADGNRFVEDHWCDALTFLREQTGYNGEIFLTNQEAIFGHIAGCGGLIKLLASIQMLASGVVAPVAGCTEPYRKLKAYPVHGNCMVTHSKQALVVTSGAGGDSTSCLIKLKEGSFL